MAGDGKWSGAFIALQGIWCMLFCLVLFFTSFLLSRPVFSAFFGMSNLLMGHQSADVLSCPVLKWVHECHEMKLSAQVPVLGRSFVEDKNSKAARRKRGMEASAASIGDFRTGCTYSFSFHSMYIDMAQVLFSSLPVFFLPCVACGVSCHRRRRRYHSRVGRRWGTVK